MVIGRSNKGIGSSNDSARATTVVNTMASVVFKKKLSVRCLLLVTTLAL